VPTTIVAVDPGEALPRFLALGDSYTIGQSVDFEERWPNQLVALMGDAGRLVATPDFIARTGWSTRDLLDAIEAAAPQGPFDLVSLQIGVNNQFGGGDLEVFRTEFRVLLGVAIELAGGDAARVLVLSIPDWSVTPFAPDGLRSRISYEVSLFNAVVGEEVTEAGVALVDVTASSKAARDDPALLAIDDLHPSGLMYAQWAQLALPDALATLQRGQED
jgi:lysophospholipase L1-like esterase